MSEEEMTLEEKWQSLTIANDYIFCEVMKDEKLCKKTLELLLDTEIDRIEYPDPQKVFKESLDSKGIRLDVYTKADNRHFDLEIQTYDEDDILKRARYYTGCIDTASLKPGDDYKNLGDVYIIFLCLKDPFKKDLPLYTFETRCVEETNLQTDKTKKLFYNVNAWEKIKNQELKEFLNYIKNRNCSSAFTNELETKVQHAKQNPDSRRVYMTLEMRERSIAREAREEGILEGRKEGIVEGRKEGRLEGKAEAKLELAVMLVKDRTYTAETAAQKCGVDLEELKSALQEDKGEI